MIEYDKFKQCHGIMLEHNKFYCMYEFGWSDRVKFELFNEDNHLCIYVTYNIDDLITRLQQLTQPEPKYKVNQKVFTRIDQEIHCFAIDEIINDGECWYIDRNVNGGYSSTDGCFDQYEEDKLYPTKADLIEAQIEYWYDLKEDWIKCDKCGIN